MAKPLWTLGQIIDQLDSGQRFQSSVISFTTDGLARSSPNSYNPSLAIVPMTQHEKLVAEIAFEVWDDLIAPAINHAHDRDADISFQLQHR